jgi:hypothetical protein
MMLLRHGETVSNLEQRYHGRLDSPLTELGIAQAQAIGRRLSTLIEASSLEIVSGLKGPSAIPPTESIRSGRRFHCLDLLVAGVQFYPRSTAYPAQASGNTLN